MRDRFYSTSEICEMFKISKTTLFRWEDEGIIPPVKRDLQNQRRYSQEHLRAIGAKQSDQLHTQMGRAVRAGDTEAMAEIEEEIELRKFLQGDPASLGFLKEYKQVPADNLRMLLRICMDYDPDDEIFVRIVDIVSKQCHKLFGSKVEGGLAP